MNITTATENLLEAALLEDLEAMRQALDAGANVNGRFFGDGCTALVMAAGMYWPHESSAAIALLIGRGADPNAPAPSGVTALISAAIRAPRETIALLLDHGADVNAASVDKNGRLPAGTTALMNAAEGGATDVVALLLERGANVKARNVEGQTALDFALNADQPFTAAVLRAATEARDLQGSLPPAPSSHPTSRPYEDLGAPDPQPVRSHRLRL